MLQFREPDIQEIQPFIDAIEAKDLYTQGHSHHVYAVAAAIFDCLPQHMQAGLDRAKLCTAALLHDMGKVNTPDEVLNKDGKLSDDEWAIMKQHPEEGVKILENTIFEDLCPIVLYHHERIDGKGYYGLSGDAIPIESRIIAIADTFSALRTYRIYRPALTIAETVAIMRDASGTQLDAKILDCFLSLDINFLENLECNCEICKKRKQALQASPSVN